MGSKDKAAKIAKATTGGTGPSQRKPRRAPKSGAYLVALAFVGSAYARGSQLEAGRPARCCSTTKTDVLNSRDEAVNASLETSGRSMSDAPVIEIVCSSKKRAHPLATSPRLHSDKDSEDPTKTATNSLWTPPELLLLESNVAVSVVAIAIDVHIRRYDGVGVEINLPEATPAAACAQNARNILKNKAVVTARSEWP